MPTISGLPISPPASRAGLNTRAVNRALAAQTQVERGKVDSANANTRTSSSTRPALRVPDTLRRILGVAPDKAYLVNLDTNEQKDFLLNPSELQEDYEAKYVRLESPGLSHERLQYVGTKNATFPLTVFFDQLLFNIQRGRGLTSLTTSDVPLPLEGNQETEVEGWRRFLQSLLYPRRISGGNNALLAASPPPVLFYWPGIISMNVRVMKLSFKHVQFDVGTTRPRVYSADVQLEEDVPPGERIYSRDVYGPLGTSGYGTVRPWAGRRS